MLMKNPSSWLQAKHNEWKMPVTQEWMLLAETFDLHMKVNSKNSKALPRPWPDPNSNRIGKHKHSDKDVKARLERMNPKEA